MSIRNSRFRNDINSRILSIVETIVNDNYELHRNHRSSLDNTFVYLNNIRRINKRCI